MQLCRNEGCKSQAWNLTVGLSSLAEVTSAVCSLQQWGKCQPSVWLLLEWEHRVENEGMNWTMWAAKEAALKPGPHQPPSCKHSCGSRGHGASFLCTESALDTSNTCSECRKDVVGDPWQDPRHKGTKPLWHTNKTNTFFQGESAEVKTALCCLRFRVGSPSPRTFSEKGWNYVLCPWSPRSFPLLRNQFCQEGGTGGGRVWGREGQEGERGGGE